MGGLRIATVRGIPIRIHLSFLIVLPLIALGFRRAMDETARYAGVDPAALGDPFVWGIVIALLLFVCVLLHELGHSLYAISTGGKVEDITLLMIGGVSRISRPPRGHAREAMMALAGPLVSLVLGFTFLAVHFVSRGDWLRFGTFYLGYLNVFLGLFNLLPAFPMDGGRVLRALLAIPLGQPRATSIAAFVGRAFAAVFVLAGLTQGNIVLILIGIVVWTGAGAERQQAHVVATFEGIATRDVMTHAPATIEAGAPISLAAARMLSEHEPALVVTDGPAIAGLLSVEDVRRIPRELRSVTAIRDAVGLRAPPIVTPDTSVATALSGFSEGFPVLPVVENGRLVGLLTPSALARARELRALGEPAPRKFRRPFPAKT